LASLTNLDDLQKFANDLVDRFGPIPTQVNDLIDLIKLRESAKKLGFVKIVLKNNLLFVTFPNENNTAYYQSNLFTNVLQFIQHNGNLCKLKQNGKVLQVIFNQVKSIDKGQELFDKLLFYHDKMQQ
jgi:transcription-repair coupling factor (superfamily II helicase)